MEFSARTEVVWGGTPEVRRVRVKGTDEVGIVIETRPITGGASIATVLFEDTGECRLYLDHPRWLEKA